MLEAMHDDGHDCDGFWHDAGGGNLSPRHFHLRGTWDRSFNQISALLISRATLTFGVTGIALVCTPKGERRLAISLMLPLVAVSATAHAGRGKKYRNS